MNQMEFSRTRSSAASVWSRKTAGICSAGRMWLLLWGIAIPAMRCVGTARES